MSGSETQIGRRVSGTLVTPSGRPPVGAVILMERRTGSPGRAVPGRVFPNGAFFFTGVEPGRYVLRASGQTEDSATTLVAVHELSVVHDHVSGLMLTLAPEPASGSSGRPTLSGSATPPTNGSAAERAPLSSGGASPTDGPSAASDSTTFERPRPDPTAAGNGRGVPASGALAFSDAAPAEAPPGRGDVAIDFETARFERSLQAVRAAGPIVIDGVMDELAWQEAPVATHFIQSEPRQGAPATDETEVWVLYDDDNLYFGVFAHDEQPHLAIINDIKRDFRVTEGDIFGVVIDTFHDRRNGYQFEVNPAGAKWDAQCFNDSREVNGSWDGVWSTATRVVENGWYAEIAVPFRTMKFTNAPTQTWGINFLRRVRRRNEDSFWSPLPRIYQIHRVSMAGTLEGLTGLRPGNNIQVKPYALGSSSQVAGEENVGDSDFGFDAKYGVTTGLTWDFTVNTDFSQVEADEQQVNLTRFSLFFPEKRDFFLENTGVFQFGPGDRRRARGGGGTGGGRTNTQRSDLIFFFSRNIGLSEDGDAIPILAGTRLTGRVNDRLSIGALNIQQRSQGAVPSTNFTALRVRQDMLANSDIGFMVLNKDESGARYNRALGADVNFRFFRGLDIGGLVAKTFSPAERLGFADPDTREELATSASLSYRDNFWELRANHLRIGEAFNDEMGFVPRVGINKTEVAAGTHIRPRRGRRWIRDIYPHWQVVNVTRRFDDQLDSRYYDYHLPVTFQNGTFIEWGINPNTENLIEPFEINSRREIAIAPGRYDFDEQFVLVRTNSSAPLAMTGRLSTGDFYGGTKKTYELGATTRFNQHLTLGANWSRNDIDLPEGAFVTDLITARVNYNFSTVMFLNSLLQYNTDARQFNSNIRFNFIHRPLSDFFLVYNERRESDSGNLINRAVIGKFTYLLQF